ncbi:MAG TPA: GspH/FimT family protein [Methylophilus sp.]
MSMSLRSNANNLVASIQLARSEAIKTNATVRLCASNDGLKCSEVWTDGWIVINADNKVIQHQQGITPGYRIKEAGGLATLSFKPTGIGATQASLTVCRLTPTVGTQERLVTVSVTGKPSVKKTTTGSCS